MDNRQTRTVQAFQRVLLFLDMNPVSPEPPLLAKSRHALQASMSRIADLQRAQRAAERDMKGGVEHRKETLRRDRMMPLKRIAKSQLKFTAAEAALNVPHKRADAQTVAEAALRMADALEPHDALLRDAGMEADFLSVMRHDAHELALTARRTESARNRRSLATSDMADEFSDAMQTVETIEGLMMLHHGSDKRTVRFWRQFRRVYKRMGRPPKRRSDGDDQMTA